MLLESRNKEGDKEKWPINPESAESLTKLRGPRKEDPKTINIRQEAYKV